MASASEHPPGQAGDSINEHFDRALELSQAERARWLAELRERKPEVAAELERQRGQRDHQGQR